MDSSPASSSTSRKSRRYKDRNMHNDIMRAEACYKTYLPGWKKNLFAEDDEWDANVVSFGFVGRLNFFNISQELRLVDDCSWAQGARILEKYLSITLNKKSSLQQWNKYHSLRRGKERLLRKWSKSRKDGLPNNIVLMTVCMLLAAKMSSRRNEVTMKTTCSFLHLFAAHEDAKYLKKLEFNIFKTLGFRLPLWSTLEVAEMISLAVGLDPKHFNVLDSVTTVVEIHRRCLEEIWKKWCYMGGKPVGVKHIGVLVVSTTCRFINYKQEAIVFQRLSALLMKPKRVIYNVTEQSMYLFHKTGHF